MTYDCSPQESRRTMCIVNPRKSWSSLTVSWQSSSNRNPHIFSNVVVFSLVESLDGHLVVLEYSLSGLLIGLWDEADLKGPKARFRWLSGIQGEHIGWFRIGMWLEERVLSWDEREKCVRCGMLNKIAETVDEWRRDSLLYDRRGRREERFWKGTELAFSNLSPDWSRD